MSSVDTRHPLFTEHLPDWEQLRDTYRGERIIKEAGFKYLPATSGQVEDGAHNNTATDGWKAWDAYRKRAVFPEVVKEAVESMLGVMHNKPPVIELPAKLEPLLERATLRHESLEALLRRINEEQLTMGRVGLLLDVPESTGAALPYVALYKAEHIINWDEGERDGTEVDALNLVVLDETEDERTGGFDWDTVEKYRVLVLGDPMENVVAGDYGVQVVRESEDFDPAQLIVPMISGVKLDRIPFVIANTKDVVAEPDDGPLLGLSNLALTIYRGEADHRQALFMQGQDTLVVIGGGEPEGGSWRTGAGASIDIPATPGADAKFIGVDSTGLSEMREAKGADYMRAESKANALIEATSRAAESGEALRVRVAARTASLQQIAQTGAFALQELLRIAAVWVGANPEEVVVTPNLDFVDERLAGSEARDIMAAKGLGAPLSLQSIHEGFQERGLTSLTWEEELERLQQEAEQGLPGATMPGTDDDDGATDNGSPEDDPDDPRPDTGEGSEGDEGEDDED